MIGKKQPQPNLNDPANMREAIENGQYFNQAHQWYKEQFVRPISQRSWMMLTAGSAVFIALAALSSISSLMPLTNRPAIPASQTRIWDHVISGERLRKDGMSRDAAVLRFFVEEYVKRRESYSGNRYDDYLRFVKVHSTEENYEAYASVYGVQNPRSLRNVLKSSGRRAIEIEKIKLKGKTKFYEN